MSLVPLSSHVEIEGRLWSTCLEVWQNIRGELFCQTPLLRPWGMQPGSNAKHPCDAEVLLTPGYRWHQLHEGPDTMLV